MSQQIRERMVNRFLTLYLIDECFENKRLRCLSEDRLQKLVFLSERDMIANGLGGFNFYFMRLYHGPYSFELVKDKVQLIMSGFVEEKTLKPTKDANYLIEDFSSIIDRNKEILLKINSVNRTYASLELNYLLDIVHSMPWNDATIHDLPLRTTMLYPKNLKSPVQFELTDKELDDLIMNLDFDICQDFDEAKRDVDERRFLTHEQVFANV